MVGDRQPFIAALVTLDPEAVELWAKTHDKSGSVADMASDPDLRATVQEAVDEANQAVSKAESIRKFAILGEDFTEDNGTLTPSMKLKRNIIMRDFIEDVESLYGS